MGNLKLDDFKNGDKHFGDKNGDNYFSISQIFSYHVRYISGQPSLVTNCIINHTRSDIYSYMHTYIFIEKIIEKNGQINLQ